jgi:hydroxymethylbilane synthase
MRIRIGTRKSKLAMAQTMWVAEKIKEAFPEVEIEIVKITTKGDKILSSPLSKIGDKGLFTKEIEEAMLRNEIDMAVHSLKDVPSVLPDGLELVAFSEREDPRDALICRSSWTLFTIPEGAVVGTSSLRRKALLKHYRKDLVVKDLRGNVDTRLKKLKEGQFDCIILAYAGLKRLGLESEPCEVISEDVFIPSVSQGILGIEARKDDEEIKNVVRKAVNCETSEICAVLERAFLRTLEGGCQVPMGCFSKIVDGKIKVSAFVSDLEGKKFLRVDKIFPKAGVKEAETYGIKVAEELIEMGAGEIIRCLK